MSLQSPLEGLKDYDIAYRTHVMRILTELRRELQTMDKGKSLLEVLAPVGLTLSDIADKLELSPQERNAFLGRKLCNDIELVKEKLTIKTI